MTWGGASYECSAVSRPGAREDPRPGTLEGGALLMPSEIHPDDFRALYPDQKALVDEQIREVLDRVTKRLGIRS